MLGLPATFAWYVFLLLVLWAFQRLTCWATRLTIFSLFLGFLVLRNGLTVPFDHTVNHWFAGIDLSAQAFRRYYISLVLMWLSLLAGVYLARLALGRSDLAPETFRQEIGQGRLPTGINGLFLPFLIGCIALVAIYEVEFDGSLTRMLTGQLTAAQYHAMRDAYGQTTHYSLGVGYRLATIARYGLFPMFIGTLYCLSRRGWLEKMLFIGIFFLTLLIGLISGQKSPAIYLMITVALAAYYRHGYSRLNLANPWLLVAVGAVWFGVLPMLYSRQYPGMGYASALQATNYRMTSENDRSLQLYFQIYPDIQPHLHGRSSSLIDSILGIDMPNERLPERFIPLYYVSDPLDYHNTWNASYIGVAWADFGYAGVAMESLFVGFLLQAYAVWFVRARKTALVVGTQVGLLMAATKLSEEPLSASLLAFGLLNSFLVFLLLKALPRKKIPPHLLPAAHENSPNCTEIRPGVVFRGGRENDL